MPSTEFFTLSGEWVVQNVYGLVTALVVFLVGWYLSDLIAQWVRRALGRAPGVDRTIAPILTEILRYAILGITLVIVLGQFGVQTASILAVLGATGLALALALQGTLSNMAAGIMLLWLRPFVIGDAIDADGTSGSVTEIGLFATRLKTYDGIYVFVPNSKLWNARIVNWSREPTRMVEIKVGIGYSASIADAREALRSVAGDPRVLPSPAPAVFVSALTDSSIQMSARLWVASANWWDAYIDLMEAAIAALQRAHVDVGRDALDVHLLDGRRSAGRDGTASETHPAAGSSRD